MLPLLPNSFQSFSFFLNHWDEKVLHTKNPNFNEYYCDRSSANFRSYPLVKDLLLGEEFDLLDFLAAIEEKLFFVQVGAIYVYFIYTKDVDVRRPSADVIGMDVNGDRAPFELDLALELLDEGWY